MTKIIIMFINIFIVAYLFINTIIEYNTYIGLLIIIYTISLYCLL